jgi:ATP-binding cassette subfamily A (ABC1) protein 3
MLWRFCRFPSELRSVTDLFGQNNWHTNILYPVYQVPGPRAPDNNTGAVPGRYTPKSLWG